MATVNKHSDKGARKEVVGAASLLDNFTHASRSVQDMAGEGSSKKSGLSAQHSYYEGIVGELQTRVRAVSRMSELSVKERIELERKGEEEVGKLSAQPANELEESLSRFIKKIKGPTYEAAVSRIAKLTGDLENIANAAPGTASHALETAINDLGTPAKKRSGSKGHETKKEEELQVAVDLKLIRKVAIIEELTNGLGSHAGSGDSLREGQLLRLDPPYNIKGSDTVQKPEGEQPIIFDLGKLDTPEKIMKQRSIIDSNISKRINAIDGMLQGMSKKEKNEITAGDLEKISDANIKLFIEISAYKDLLVEMKDNLGAIFPGDREMHEAHAKSIDALVKKIGDAGSHSNKGIAELADEKGLGVSKVPMFVHDIREMQRDLYSIRDPSGKSIYERLGANVLFYEEGNDSERIVKQITEDYEEIMRRLGGRNNAVLIGYEKEYPDMSELVIAQLAAIGVQLKWEGSSGTVHRIMEEDTYVPYTLKT